MSATRPTVPPPKRIPLWLLALCLPLTLAANFYLEVRKAWRNR